MILLTTDVFRADEPLANWVLDDWEDNATMSSSLGLNVHGWVDDKLWFSRGGMVFQANLQNPTLTYLRRNEVPAAIRNLYNDFVACYYPSVNAFTEEYHQWRSPSGPFYKIPDEAPRRMPRPKSPTSFGERVESGRTAALAVPPSPGCVGSPAPSIDEQPWRRPRRCSCPKSCVKS